MKKESFSWSTGASFYLMKNASLDCTQRERAHFFLSLNGRSSSGGKNAKICFVVNREALTPDTKLWVFEGITKWTSILLSWFGFEN